MHTKTLKSQVDLLLVVAVLLFSFSTCGCVWNSCDCQCIRPWFVHVFVVYLLVLMLWAQSKSWCPFLSLLLLCTIYIYLCILHTLILSFWLSMWFENITYICTYIYMCVCYVNVLFFSLSFSSIPGIIFVSFDDFFSDRDVPQLV